MKGNFWLKVDSTSLKDFVNFMASLRKLLDDCKECSEINDYELNIDTRDLEKF